MVGRREAKEWAKAHLRGLICSPSAPFTPDFALDEAGVVRNVESELARRLEHQVPARTMGRQRAAKATVPDVTGSFATPMDLGVEGEDVFVGPAPPDRGFRTHGGQVLAQSLGAAQRTVSSDRAVHSIHSYFLTAGHAAKPLDYGDFIETILPVVEHPWPGRSRPMDVRYVNAPTVPDSRPVTEPQVMWSCL